MELFIICYTFVTASKGQVGCILFQAVNLHTYTHITHLFVPETHLAGQLIVVSVSSPSDHRHHMGLKQQETESFFFFSFYCIVQLNVRDPVRSICVVRLNKYWHVDVQFVYNKQLHHSIQKLQVLKLVNKCSSASTSTLYIQ